MKRDLDTMDFIQNEKIKEVQKEDLMPLDEEGVMVAEHKRFTIDMVGTPVDPLR